MRACWRARIIPSLADAIAAYLSAEAFERKPSIAALAVAAPVVGDAVTFTNHPWSFSIKELQRRLGLERVLVVNDFAANALAVPQLGPDSLIAIGGGSRAEAAPIAVIGPGTGLGMSALAPTRRGLARICRRGRARDAPRRRRAREHRDCAYAPPLRPCLGRARAVGAGAGQPLSDAGGDRGRAGGALQRGADRRSRARRERAAVPRRHGHVLRRCWGRWRAISR